MLQIRLQFEEEAFELLEVLDHLVFLAGFFTLLQEFAGAFNGELSPAEQVVDQLEVLDIGRLEEAVALAVLAGFDDVEFIFPVADE